jgi:outer membrane protein assembly factor BamB
VFTTETRGEKQEVVFALDRETGKPLWESSWDGAMTVPFFAKANGDWIRATPAFDGERLYVAGMRDVLVCLDAKTGKSVWQVDFTKEFGTPLPSFGFVCSPLVDGEFLYVQAGGGFCKLDKHTGNVVWRVLEDGGGMMDGAFSSPFLGEMFGKRQLFVQTRDKLAGVDPDDGAVLWSQPIPAYRGMNILTPTVFGDSVFTSAYGGKSVLLQVKGDAGSATVSEAWTNRATGYMSSPIVIDGCVYMHMRNQRFTCMDLATGATRWTSQPFGEYWSLVANGDRILALDETGELLLIRANPEKFELIDSLKVSEDPAWAHLAVCGDEIFIRELNALAAYRWRSADSP